MNEANCRFNGRGAERGDAARCSLSSRSCHSREPHRHAQAWHRPAASAWNTKWGSCRNTAPEQWEHAPENELPEMQLSLRPALGLAGASYAKPLISNQVCWWLCGRGGGRAPWASCLLHAWRFCCQHSSYMNSDTVDDEEADWCLDTLATHTQRQAGGHSTAWQGREEADLGLQGPRKPRCWWSCCRPAQRSDILKEHWPLKNHTSSFPLDICTGGMWAGGGLSVYYAFLFASLSQF